MLGLLGVNKFLLGGVAIVAALAIGYHFWTASALNAEIAQQAKQITGLTEDNTKLKISIEGMEEAAKIQKEASDRMVAEITALREADAAHDAELAAARQEVQAAADRVAEYLERPDATPDGAEDIVDAINKQLNCRIAHMGESGKCVNGEWKPS